MNRDLDYMIEVMQAARDGKRIQCDADDRYGWIDADHPPAWNWARCDYRIKPEPRKPREWKIAIDKRSGTAIHYREGDERCQTFEIVTVREVLPEE